MNENASKGVRSAVPLALMLLGIGLSACAQAGIGRDSWKEEVLLHDGQKLIVERSQTYGGRHEIGQSPPVKEHSIRFKLPTSSKVITWTSEYGDDLGRTNFKLVALHVSGDTPYLVAVPNLCLSYNKWGRPNPPYVIFKLEDNKWKRISIGELPSRFNEINLVVNNQGEAAVIVSKSLVNADLIKKLNGELEQSEYKTILREPMAREPCPQYSSSPKAPIKIAPSIPAR